MPTGTMPRRPGAPAARTAAFRVVSGIAVVATLVAAVLAAKLARRPAAPVARLQLELADLRVNHVGYFGVAFTLAPDGSRLAYIAARTPGPSRLMVRERDALAPRVLEGTEGADGPFFSPDGDWIGYFADGKVFKVSAAGGTPIKLAEGASSVIPSGAWLGDDQIVFTSSSFGLATVPASGGTASVLVADPEEGLMALPTPLPRRDVILVTVCTNNCAQVHLVALNLTTLAQDTVARNAARAFYLSSGHLVFLQADGTLVGAPFDLDRLRLKRPPVPLVSGVQLELGVVPEIALAGDGTLIYLPAIQSSGVGTIVAVDRTGRSRVLDPSWQARFTSLALSPDGGRLAVSTAETDGNVLWVKQLEQGPLTRLSFGGTINYRPAWLPDGRSLSFSADLVGPRTYLYRLRSDGSDEPTRLFPGDTAQVDEATWSKDGSWVIYRTGTVPGVRDIYARRVREDTARITVAAGRADEYMPALSPDGRWVAYVSVESGREEVFVRPFPEVDRARTQVSVAGGAHPVWAPSGRELYYVERADTLMAVGVGGDAEFRASYRRPLFSTRPYILFPYHQAFAALPGDQGFLMLARAGMPLEQAGRLVVVLNWTAEARARMGAAP